MFLQLNIRTAVYNKFMEPTRLLFKNLAKEILVSKLAVSDQ